MFKSRAWQRGRSIGALGASLLLVSGLAGAHAKLTSTIPKADSTVSSPQMIQVHFSEAIEMKLSSLKLAGSDGAAISIMAMNDAKDPTTLSIMPNASLKPGVYTVTWNIVSDDGHKGQGTFSFRVK